MRALRAVNVHRAIGQFWKQSASIIAVKGGHVEHNGI